MEAIPSAYHHLGREHESLHANPHSLWGVAASWAKTARALATEICHAYLAWHVYICPVLPVGLFWRCFGEDCRS